jgi:hypothetical protein
LRIEVVLEDRVLAAARNLQAVQDVLSLVVLVPAAWARIGGGHPLMLGLAALEVVAIVLAVLSMARQLLGRSHGSAGVEWLNVFFGVVLLLEYGSRRLSGGKAIDPALVTGLLVLALAFSPVLRRFRARRRCMTMDDEGIRVRKSMLRRMKVRWADLASIEERGRTVWFVGRRGRRRSLSLRRYRNAHEIRDALARGATAMSVSYLPEQPGPDSRARESTIPTRG